MSYKMCKRIEKLIFSGLVALFVIFYCITARAEYDIAIKIPVSVQVLQEGDATQEDAQSDQVTIVISPGEDGVPMPGETEIKVNGNGTIEFGPINYTEPGNYHYVISQLNRNTPDWSYDTGKFNVTVCIFSDDDGVLSSMISASRTGQDDKELINFQNRVEKHYPPTETDQSSDGSEKDGSLDGGTGSSDGGTGSNAGGVGNAQTGAKGSVQTGDTSNAGFIISLIIAVALLLIGIGKFKKTERRAEK